MEFVLDAMLGRLARWLRFLGYDTLYVRKGEDTPLLELALTEGRILLTRDTHLIKRRLPIRCLFIRSDHLVEQLRQVIEELDLPVEGVGTRCMRCNVLLELLEKAQAEGLVPDFVFRAHQAFFRCRSCRRIYWPGSHFRRMEEALQRSVLSSHSDSVEKVLDNIPPKKLCLGFPISPPPLAGEDEGGGY